MVNKLPVEEEVWDKKRVVIGFFVLVILVIGIVVVKNVYFPNFHLPGSSVLGVQTQRETIKPVHFSLPSTDGVEQKIQDIQEQAKHINVSDMASSSPQVQAILKQLQDLPNLPKNVAKQACIDLCSKL